MGSRYGRRSPVAGRPAFWLAGVAVLCSATVLFASARHTGSLAFPIDDGYIYSNYVLQAAGGHFFTYNPAETSGGITGVGWYLLSTLAYWLLAPLHVLLGGLAPDAVRAASPELAAQAGHLYIAAYLPGVALLALTAVGTYRLALAALPSLDGRERFRGTVAWLAGAVAAADSGLVWGALSGLEVPLSTAVAAWAMALLVEDVGRGALRWSLLLVALLPWARPDLLAVSAAGLLWLLLRALFDRDGGIGPHAVGLYAAAAGAGALALGVVYFVGWGKPLPSSFYAKVGGLRLGARALSAVEEWVLAGHYLPFVGGALALLGGLASWLFPARGAREGRWSALLLLLVSIGYTLAMMVTLPWFGQEDRYLLPVHPFVLALLAVGVWRVAALLPSGIEGVLARRWVAPALGLAIALVAAVGDYVWATRTYAVEVRNIQAGHIVPALALRARTPASSVVAAEPIGAVRLFSERRTVDLVGLTSPATLGTYRDWPRAWEALHAAGANFLLFYPDWFDDGSPGPWVIEWDRFTIPDNRIAGSDVIAVYELRWERYTGVGR